MIHAVILMIERLVSYLFEKTLNQKEEEIPPTLCRQTFDKQFCQHSPQIVQTLSRTHTFHSRPYRQRIHSLKLPALVYDILPSTTAVFSYAIGSRKLSANEQFFVGAQTVVNMLQTTQIKQGVSFIAANKVYTSTNKTTIV